MLFYVFLLDKKMGQGDNGVLGDTPLIYLDTIIMNARNLNEIGQAAQAAVSARASMARSMAVSADTTTTTTYY